MEQIYNNQDLHTNFLKIAETVYQNIRFVTECDNFRRPKGHGVRMSETSGDNIRKITLTGADGITKTYFFNKKQFSLYTEHNGFIWDKEGDNVDECGISYRINTNVSDIEKVVNEYLNNPKEYALDCASFTCLTLLGTLLETFKGRLDIKKLSRQDAIISGAILYTRDEYELNINKYLPFKAVGFADEDISKAQLGDLVIWKSRKGEPEDNIDEVAAHTTLVKEVNPLVFYNPLIGLTNHIHRIFRLDTCKFLDLWKK